jgi:hypothetical protein
MTLEEIADWFGARGVDYAPPAERGDVWIAGYTLPLIGEPWLFAGETAEDAARGAYTNAELVLRTSYRAVREIPLLLEPDEAERLGKLIADLKERYGTTTVTETILYAIRDERLRVFGTDDPYRADP